MSIMDRDTLLSSLESAPRPEEDALLMAGRFVPLRSLERAALLLQAPTVKKLLALDHYGVERCIGRPLRRTPWNPEELREATGIDRRWLAGGTRHVWWIGDHTYPGHLRRIWDPPAVLYGWGESSTLACPGIAVVGTREPDEQGRAAAYRLGLDLGQRGVVVVSGLARGIDSAAHRGAVISGTPAIAVLGSGIDSIYPRENRALAADLLGAGGLIVSEYPPGTPAHRTRFPARNRIVVGLSAGIVVVQAPERSGALISADFGLQNGVEVMVHSSGKGWSGCSRLRSEGAATVTTANDVITRVSPEALPGSIPAGGGADAEGDSAARAQLAAEERKLALLDSPSEVKP
ncbi:MAG: DNA-protecting protein DprA [Spirochaetaceae bacterium]|nr:MAG: DNA-protecting protein DprA [Spirochaetaceae bacterium]